MALNVTVEPKENRQLTMKIQVEQERVDRELRKAARKVAGQYRIPGFRPGKAPYSVLVQYVGLPTLFNEFIEPLGEELYKQALEQEKIEPYAQASLDVSSLEPLTYELTIPLDPEIDLGDYRNLRVEATPVQVEESEVEAELQQMLEEGSEWREVARPSTWGDVLILDVRSVLAPEEGEEAGDEETVVLDETEWEVTLDEENPLEPAGFDQALLGMSAGEEKEFTLRWPEDSRSIYKGKTARFSVKVHRVEGHETPALDDEFAQSVGPDFATLEDLKAHVRGVLEAQRQAEADNNYMDAVLDKLVEQSTMDYPPAVVEDQIDSMISEFNRQLRQYGIDGLEAFLQQTGQSMEEYRAGLREQAEVMAKRNLVISELYRLEGIEVTDEEVEEHLSRFFRAEGIEAAANAGEDEGGPEESAGDALAAPTADATAEEETPEVAEAVEGVVEAQAEAGGAGETDEESAAAERDASVQAFRNLMLRGAGRQMIESQILQQKALERLRAIARGEEVPPLPPKPSASTDADAEPAETPDAVAEGESGSDESRERA